MKKYLAFLLGTALASGTALAQEQQDPMQDTTQDTTSEYGEEVGEWGENDSMSQTEAQDPTESGMDDPTMGETQESTTYGQESGMQHDLSDMSAEELKGMTLVSSTGEEIGQIDRIGQSEEHQARVATVDVGGFLGVAEKTIAIPLSELEMSSDGNVQTTMTKEEIQGAQEFDEQGFTEEGGTGTEDTGY